MVVYKCKDRECFVSSTLAVANMKSVNQSKLLCFDSFGTEAVVAKRSRVGAALWVGRSFVALDTKHDGMNILEGTNR